VKRKVILALLIIMVVIGALTVIVAVPISKDLGAVRARLEGGSIADLDDAEVAAVRTDVNDVLDRIHSIPGKILGVIPILSSNLEAVEGVSESLLPALDTGLELRRKAERLEDEGLVDDGRIDVDGLASLRGPLAKEVAALKTLEEKVTEGRSGLNAPAVWDALTTLSTRVSEVKDDAEAFAALLDELDALLGAKSKRTYLVMLLNNAELRGSGGVMTGIGTISVNDGKLHLGEFDSVHDLRGPQLIRVPAPATYRRRYSKYLANTTVWLNTAYSPDIPDDALVTSRLYEEVTGIKTDGAIVADPRGIAAMLPEDAKVPVPGIERILSPKEIPGFTYSGAYESFASQDARRDALIGVGESAFKIAVDEGLRGRDVLKEAGRAVGAGHLRVASFDESERAALVASGAAGQLPVPEPDGLMVLAQNRGDKQGHGTKLDYWIDRDVGHACEITPEEATCVTRTTLRNEAPTGLIGYAAGGPPYGLLRTFLETYVPAKADVTGFEINDESTNYIEEPHESWTSVGTDLEVPRGKSATVEVAYDLPLSDSYALTAAPQPLAKDAAVEIALRLPQDWVVRGPGRQEDEIFHYEGPMDDLLSIKAEPDQTTGLPALWQTLVSFWQEPLF
jgi:hypothetical protein